MSSLIIKKMTVKIIFNETQQYLSIQMDWYSWSISRHHKSTQISDDMIGLGWDESYDLLFADFVLTKNI